MSEIERVKQEIIDRLTKRWWKFAIVSGLVSGLILTGLFLCLEKPTANETLAKEMLAKEMLAKETPAETWTVTLWLPDGTWREWETEEKPGYHDYGSAVMFFKPVGSEEKIRIHGTYTVEPSYPPPADEAPGVTLQPEDQIEIFFAHHTHELDTKRTQPDRPLSAPKPWDYCPHCGSLRR